MSIATNKATETTPAQWKALASAMDRCVCWYARLGTPVMGADEAVEISARIGGGLAGADDLLVIGAMAPLMSQNAYQAGGETLKIRALTSLGIVRDGSDAARAAAFGAVETILSGGY